MIGTLGAIVFEVSSEKVLTFDGLSRNRGANYHKHQVILEKAKLEFLNPNLDTISLPIRLDIFMGVNPIDEINKIGLYVYEGHRLPLIIGGRFFGYFVIESTSETFKRIDNLGNIIVADINLSLLEAPPG